MQVALEAQTRLDTVTRVCLVHSDLNPKNLLFDPETLALTGVLDWEFAHAGHPFSDLGNLLRFDRAPAFAEAVLAAYESRRGVAAGGGPGAGPSRRPLRAGRPGDEADGAPGRRPRGPAAPRDRPGARSRRGRTRRGEP